MNAKADIPVFVNKKLGGFKPLPVIPMAPPPVAAAPAPEPEPAPKPTLVPKKYQPVSLPAGANTLPNLTERAVLIRIRFRLFGNSKKVSSDRIHVMTHQEEGEVQDEKVNKKRLRVTKSLLESPELAAIDSFDGQVEKFVKGLCLPYEIGIHLLPVTVLTLVENKLKQFAGEREVLVQKFLAKYESQCKSASEDLSSVFNPTDYPSLSSVAKKFDFEWSYMALGAPDQLKGISEEVWQEAKEKEALKMQEAGAEIQGMLREAMCKLVEHLALSLSPDPDTGKKRTFHGTTVSNLMDFLGNFNFRNVTDDEELQKQVTQARELMKGIDVKDLKKNEAVRDNVQKGMEAIAKTLDEMLVTSGRRKMDLED
jgi:hypothetical protein